MSCVLPDVLSQLGCFLRKNQRALRISTLACVTAVVTRHGCSVTPADLEPVLGELPALLDESDMHVSQVSVTLLTCVAAASPASLARISCSVLPRVIGLIQSPLLQGGVLATIQDFLQALVLSNSRDLGYR